MKLTTSTLLLTSVAIAGAVACSGTDSEGPAGTAGTVGGNMSGGSTGGSSGGSTTGPGSAGTATGPGSGGTESTGGGMTTGGGAVMSAADGGSTDRLTHAQTFTVSGTFVAKPMAAPLVWDNCAHGQDPKVRWSATYPNGSTSSTTSSEDWGYRATPFTRPTGAGAAPIAHPHAHGTFIAAGGLSAPKHDANSTAVGANKEFTRPEFPFFTLSTWWERVDPAWDETRGDPQDNNFKLWDWSVGSSWYGDDYWYVDYSQNKQYDSINKLSRVDLTAPSYETNDDSVPQYLTPPHTWGKSGSDARQWVLRTIVAYWAEAPDGRISLYEGDLAAAKSPLSTNGQTADNYAGKVRNLAIGGYNRAVGSGNNWRYFADLFQDVGEGWFYLTNSESWATSTVSVLQPWTTVTTSTATLECNGGNLPSGTVYLHYRVAPWKTSGHQYLGAFALN